MVRRLIVISGAGISAESGIRTFRTDEKSGRALWDEYDLEKVCNIHSFRGDNYYLTHEFYNKRREELQSVEPNLAHLRIAEWYKRYPDQVVNLTTNVDDLFERAGIPEKGVLHIHGFLKELVIMNESGYGKAIKDIGFSSINPDDYGFCKPNIVFFGEMAPNYPKMYDTLDTLSSGDLVLLVGCSNTVLDFDLELLPATARGAKVVVINPRPTPLENASSLEGAMVVYQAPAVETFSNKHFIKMVEDHLEGKTSLQKRG